MSVASCGQLGPSRKLRSASRGAEDAKRAPGAYLSLLLAAVWVQAVSAQEVPSQGTSGLPSFASDSVVLRVAVPAEYDRSPASVALVGLLIKTLPPIQDSLPHDVTYHQFILDRYNISIGTSAKRQKQDLPETFDSLSKAIAHLNGLDNRTNNLPAGRILRPAVPPKASWMWDKTVPASYGVQTLSARVTEGAGTALPPGPAKLAPIPMLDSGFAVIAGATATPARERVLFLTVSVDQAAALIQQAAPLFAQGRGRVLNAPLRFSYGELTAAEAGAVGAGVVTSSLADSIRARLAAPIRQHVPLIVVESAWPDAPTADTSCRRVFSILDTLRVRWGLGPATERACAAGDYHDPLYTHSALVAASLHSVEGLAPPGVVDVAIIPMSRDQGAAPLLRELIRVSEILSDKVAVLKDSLRLRDSVMAICQLNVGLERTFPRCVAALPIDTSRTRVANDIATSFVKSLPDRIAQIPGTHDFESGSMILSDLFPVLAAYTLVRETGAFVSTSWIVPSLIGSQFLPVTATPTVLLAAATGNDNRVVNTNEAPIEFARWSVTTKQVLAVMDQDSVGGRACKSSMVDSTPSLLLTTNVVGFDGDIDRNECGTSFSTPRVAWLLAADEATRPGPLPIANWAGLLSGRLLIARSGTRDSLRLVHLDPLRFLRPRQSSPATVQKPATTPPSP